MPMGKTSQLKCWEGTFGRAYTKRNVFTCSGLDKLYKTKYGIKRSELDDLFLRGLNRSARILEVGTNIGTQLMMLQGMGFESLYGIDPQAFAVEAAKRRLHGINVIQGDAFNIPFKDGFFDMVFTSGVLIHIHPKNIGKAIDEIHRCARRFIWGFEYYSKDYAEIRYRGQENLLWKADYAQLFRERFPNLQLMKKKIIKYSDSENADMMFLLRKRS